MLLAGLAVGFAPPARSEPCDGIRVSLSWGGSRAATDEIHVYRSSGPEPAVFLGPAVVADGTVEYCDETAEPGVTYFYSFVVVSGPHAGSTAIVTGRLPAVSIAPRRSWSAVKTLSVSLAPRRSPAKAPHERRGGARP